MEKKEKDVLEELKDCYNKGLLSALVGAGFSKNVSSMFLGWGELLHDMIGELYEIDIKRNYDNYLHQSYGVIPVPKSKEALKDEYISEICKHEDYLELVSKYIQKKGIREALEIYIESRIPYVAFNAEGKIVLKIGNKEKEQILDTKFSAHKELLLLNKLQNVYTTNYENLIEFTIDLLGLGIKDAPKIVRSGRDLSDNIRNRNIIKIHGNLRKESGEKINFDGDNKLQYIIAKEDYDTYKEKHEAFTSLMRIAMLQGKFMLLGFSGTDANYKGWVTWMSDVLEGENDNVTKIYIIDVGGKDTPPDLQLYYDNHHTKVVNLISEERLRTIGFEDKDVILILQKQKDEKLDNDTKRTILTKFLNYLQIGASESDGFINNDFQTSPNDKGFKEGGSVEMSFSIIKNESYEYRKIWQEALSKINDNDAINEIVERIKNAKPKNRFPKIIYNQDYIIDEIVRKTNININDAFLISLAIDECGLNPHYYSQLIKDYEYLDKLPLWNLLKIKEETFNGKEANLSGTDDEIIYENIQRNLFRLDFKIANKIIKSWEPNGYYIVLKAMRLASQDNQRDNAFKLLSDYIEKEDDPSSKLYAMQIANYISNKYPWPYNTEDFYQYGVDGIGDNLDFMIQQLRGKIEAPRARGWIGSTLNFGGSHPEYEKSLRILRYISDCGIYLNFGFTCFFDKAKWYLVFKNLYEEFPYPCFFYSIQYHDKDLLTRIGQDFAYSPKLCNFNEEILLKSIIAIGDEQPPSLFLNGLLYTIGPIYMSVDEELWFDSFFATIFSKIIVHLDRYDLSSPFVKNVEYALTAIRHQNNIYRIMSSLMVHYSENSRLVDYLMRNCLHIEYLKDEVSNDIRMSFDSLIADYPHTDITDLLFCFNQHNLIAKETLYLFIEKFKAADIETIPKNLVSSMHLCILTQGDANAFEKAKDIFLNQDIWHCGIMIDGKGWSSPHYIRLAVLKDQIIWSDKDFERICANLIKNITLYDDAHSKLHEESFMRNEQVSYLSDVLQFIDSLTPERKETLIDLKGRVEALLKERINYNTLIEGMLSEQSMDVSYVIDNVVQGIMANGVSLYIDEFNFILDRAILGEGLTINKMLDGVRLVVRNKPDEVISLGLCPKLNLLLSVYQSRWQELKEFKPVWSFNYLYEIAEFLKEQNYVEDEAIKYWLTDPFVLRFIRQ